MKTRSTEDPEELRPEYDFASMEGGVRGKYAKKYQENTNLILLSPDVAKVFHDNNAVNEALRGLIGIARAKVPPRKKSFQPTS